MEEQNSNQQLMSLPQSQITSLVTTGNAAVTADSAMEVFTSPNPKFLVLRKKDKHTLKKAIAQIAFQQMRLMWPNDSVAPIALLLGEDIVESKPDWCVNDVDLLFKFIRRIQNGNEETKQYRKLDSIYLMQMVGKYEEWKADERVQSLQRFKQSELLDNTSAVKDPSQHIESIKQLLARSKMVKLNPIPRLKTEAEARQNKWMNQFEDIYKKTPTIRFPERLIHYYRSDSTEWIVVDSMEYVCLKQEQYNRVVKALEARKEEFNS